MTQEQVDKVLLAFHPSRQRKNNKKIWGNGFRFFHYKNVCEMMGGDIGLKSVNNEGTTFTVSDLQAIIDPKKVREKLTSSVINKDSKFFSILVIDDDLNTQELMKKFLAKENYNVIQATSGKDGLKLAKHCQT